MTGLESWRNPWVMCNPTSTIAAPLKIVLVGNPPKEHPSKGIIAPTHRISQEAIHLMALPLGHSHRVVFKIEASAQITNSLKTNSSKTDSFKTNPNTDQTNVVSPHVEDQTMDSNKIGEDFNKTAPADKITIHMSFKKSKESIILIRIVSTIS